jgi:hypothetical protein
MGFGSILIAAAAMTIIEHLPSPWGLGTLPGGLESIPPEGMSFEDKQAWLGRVLVLIFGIGFAGLIFFITGGITALISKLKNNSISN